MEQFTSDGRLDGNERIGQYNALAAPARWKCMEYDDGAAFYAIFDVAGLIGMPPDSATHGSQDGFIRERPVPPDCQNFSRSLLNCKACNAYNVFSVLFA